MTRPMPPHIAGKFLETTIVPGEPADLMDQHMMEYVTLTNNCCYSVKGEARPDFNQQVLDGAERMRTKSFAQVKASALGGNAEDSLEVGIRLYAGCGTPADEQGALWFWRRIGDKHTTGHIAHASRSIRARACSCLSNAYREHRLMGDGVSLSDDALYLAGKYGDECAELGFVTPCILAAADDIEARGFRPKADAKPSKPGTPRARFEALTNLWEVSSRHRAMLERRSKRIDEKVMKSPHAHICAAPGCGVEATKKSALMQCGGPCPPEIKPAYCSKECQKKDWKRHKPLCKAGAKPPPTGAAEEGDMGLRGGDQPVCFNDDGKERSVFIPDPQRPGETMRLTSSTLSPSLMRAMREVALDAVHERDNASGAPA